MLSERKQKERQKQREKDFFERQAKRDKRKSILQEKWAKSRQRR
jgi:hypothetical protein